MHSRVKSTIPISLKDNVWKVKNSTFDKKKCIKY